MIAGEHAITTAGCGLANAYALSDGALLWTHHEDCTGGEAPGPAFDGGWLWGEGSPDYGRIYDADTGTLIHTFDGSTPAFDAPLALRVSDGRTRGRGRALARRPLDLRR